MRPVLPIEYRAGTLPGTHRDLAEAYIDFATKKSSPIHGMGSGNSVYFLGTYWDEPPTPAITSIQIPSEIPLFVNPIISIVSVEEHTNEFPSQPTEKQVMGKTEDIINDTDAEITIRQKNGPTTDFSIGQLQRIQVPYRKRQALNIGKGVWPNYPDGGTANACWDGYFLALEGFEKTKTYEIELKSDSPYLGKPGHRYHSSFTYDITVI
jgi:hypothetical protein